MMLVCPQVAKAKMCMMSVDGDMASYSLMLLVRYVHNKS